MAKYELPAPALAAVDEVGVNARAAQLAGRSIKKQTKLAALDLAIRCMDLTTLEGADSWGKIKILCAKAIHPDSANPTIPSVAAVCVYSNLAPLAATCLKDSGVKVAAVATGFPTGQTPLDTRLAEAYQAAQTADEIDMVISRGAFLAGNYDQVYDEITLTKAEIGDRCLKVILETGELGSLQNVRRASWLAMEAGADFIKTSTGIAPVGKTYAIATPAVALVMMEAIRDYAHATGRIVGFKAAGGIKTAKQAITYLIITNETLGSAWLTPDLFRLGASSLLNDVLMQIAKEGSGFYQSADDFSES